jgi:hypothetical protein
VSDKLPTREAITTQFRDMLYQSVAEEREAAAAIADAMALRHPQASDLLQSVAAQIRQRGKP